MDEAKTVPINSIKRLRAVARLADEYAHRGAHEAVRALALAAGCKVRGGRIYAPRYHPRDTGPYWTGWARFRWHLRLGDIPESLVNDMLTHAERQGSRIEISPKLVAHIREGSR